jgi:hypothetical protein
MKFKRLRYELLDQKCLEDFCGPFNYYLLLKTFDFDLNNESIQTEMKRLTLRHELGRAVCMKPVINGHSCR